MKNAFIITLGTLLILGGGCVTGESRKSVADDLEAACPKTYANDLLEFQYPCSWLLTNEGNGGLVFTNFYQVDKTRKEYFWIDHAAEAFVQCASGENYSERTMTIPSVDGQYQEACYHAEHGSETLTVRSDRSTTGFISISSEGYLESVIIPSLKMK
jgi:hypothetical protein